MRRAAAGLLVVVLLGGCAPDPVDRRAAPVVRASAPVVSVSPSSSEPVVTTVVEVVTTTAPEVTSVVTSSTSTTVEVEEPVVGGGSSLGVFEATCYALRGTTATGSEAGPGSIAVDPRVIPLGTELEVEGYGRGVAVDTGGAIRGRIIDVWKSSEAACVAWGRRSVEVWIV